MNSKKHIVKDKLVYEQVEGFVPLVGILLLEVGMPIHIKTHTPLMEKLHTLKGSWNGQGGGRELFFILISLFALGFKWTDAWSIYTPQTTITSLYFVHNINKPLQAFTP